MANLRSGLSNNKIQYTDTSGNVVTTTSSSTRRALEKQLDQAISRQTVINDKVDILNEKLFNYETEIVEVSTNSNIAGELGPLKYLSGLTGIPMDEIINYLLLTIIFVFDPLAIALVIAANFAFNQIPNTNYIPNPIKIRQSQKVKMSVPDGMEFNKSYPILQDEDERRMDIIGQNGNDGLHYDELDLNRDGIIDQDEINIKIKSLKNQIASLKTQGNDAAAVILQHQLDYFQQKN